MAIKNIIAKGVGFSPNTTGWIVTHGFGAVAVVPTTPGMEFTQANNLLHYTMRPNLLHCTMPANLTHYTMRES
tara:strand:- start:913 stop:1131 length:219 start_codon:yes stop_codon:yes gene_type:complete